MFIKPREGIGVLQNNQINKNRGNLKSAKEEEGESFINILEEIDVIEISNSERDEKNLKDQEKKKSEQPNKKTLLDKFV